MNKQNTKYFRLIWLSQIIIFLAVFYFYYTPPAFVFYIHAVVCLIAAYMYSKPEGILSTVPPELLSDLEISIIENEANAGHKLFYFINQFLLALVNWGLCITTIVISAIVFYLFIK